MDALKTGYQHVSVGVDGKYEHQGQKRQVPKANTDSSFSSTRRPDKGFSNGITVKARNVTLNSESQPASQKRGHNHRRRSPVEEAGLKTRTSASSSSQKSLISMENSGVKWIPPITAVPSKKLPSASLDSMHETHSLKGVSVSDTRRESPIPNERGTARVDEQDPHRSLSSPPSRGHASLRDLAGTGSISDHGQNFIEDQAQVIAKLEAELCQKEREIKALERQLKEADDDLQGLRLEKQHHISDDYLRGLWNTLKYKIQTHTNQRFVAQPSSWPTDLFRDLTDEAVEYMSNSITTRKLFEAVIWRFLVKNVFSLDGLVWAGSAREPLEKLSHEILARVFNGSTSREDYHAWRARSAAIISPGSFHSRTRSTEEREIVDGLTLELEQQLEPYQIPNYDLDAGPNSWDLIRDAVEIDILLRRSRAEYSVFMYHPVECHDFSRISEVETYGFEFDEALMDREDGLRPLGTNNNRVHLVVSPVVLKKGTAEGDRYNQLTVICKRGVLCK
ncbi:hypothetical protein F5Y13DRAFT_193425 [Hypoxylon sp. FL1857]|nr:hypothetical protein F5Y13DRAFT_193425 [Hypoxylon sp. FL1857]